MNNITPPVDGLITYEEYEKLDYHEKKKYLNSYFGTKDCVLKGTVHNINPDLNYFFIDEITNLNDDKIYNPFTQTPISVVYCRQKEIKRVDLIGKKVIFKFEINNQSDRVNPKEKTIFAVPNSIKLMHKLEEIYNELDSDTRPDFIEFAIKVYAPTKVVTVGELTNIVEQISQKYHQKIAPLKVELVSLKDEIAESEQRKAEAENEILALEQRKAEITEKLKVFAKWGFCVPELGDNTPQETFESGEIPEDRIEYIQKHLCFGAKPLYYDRNTLEMFYAALCTNQLVVLCGEPGSGKTSLVEGFAKAVGAACTIISVQSNWSDNEDLLGFFDPVNNRYYPTPFLDAIIDAGKNPNRLHIICLDEMNLAQVEYYFSEFLSQLEVDKRTITLIPESALQGLKDVSEKLNAAYKNGVEPDEELRSKETQWNNLMRYHKINIPYNVRFVGTINRDETTKNLSPKVVDRSVILYIEGENSENKADIEQLKQQREKLQCEYKKALHIGAGEFAADYTAPLSDELVSKIDAVKEILRKKPNNKIYLNYRFDKQARALVAGFRKTAIGNVTDEYLFDCITLLLILPKINTVIDKNTQWQNEFENQLIEAPKSKRLFKRMVEAGSSSKIITYWM